jgi:hypothetical protein
LELKDYVDVDDEKMPFASLPEIVFDVKIEAKFVPLSPSFWYSL